LLPDSEGAGEFRGAPSIAVEFGPVDTEISVGYVSDGAINAPQGVRGGGVGGHADQRRVLVDGTVEPLDACAQVTLRPGERILSISTGGGGYGSPALRDPQSVAADVREKWISVERAREIYGVAVQPDGAVDVERTATLRAEVHS
jgi:N-methylhydantoinase B